MGRGPVATYISTVEELKAIVPIIKEANAFTFDVETRGNIQRHPDVMDLIEYEWKEKLASMKSEHPTTVARSRQAIEDRWTSELALDPFRNEVFWLGIGTAGHSWAIPMGHPNGEVLVKEMRGDGSTVPPPGHRALTKSGKESSAKAKFFIPAVFDAPPPQLTQGEVFGVLEEIFMDESILKVNQNIKFDAKSVAKYLGGRLPAGDYVDTQILMFILDEDRMSYSLENMLTDTYKFNPYGREGKIGKTITTEPFSKACRYVHYDARWTWMLFQDLWSRINVNQKLYEALTLDVRATRVVAQMEMNGILVNKRKMKDLGKELDMSINEAMRDLAQYAWPEFNPDSNPDKAKLLFNKKKDGGLGLKPKKVSQATGAPSVDKEVLEDLVGEHEVVQKLLDYNELRKAKSTYIEGMIPLLHPVKGEKNLGLVHPQFHFHRAATGRFSSSDPNLQNIPRDGRMRSLFVAGPGDSLVVADYSQIEMRLMAMFSQDPELLNIFDNDIDVHTGTATVILGRPPADSEERNVYGKVPNFLMGYGGGPKRLIVATGGKLTLDQAKQVVENYNNGYAGLTRWKYDVIREAARRGYVETLGGRRRRLADLSLDGSSREAWVARSRAERQAVNAIIQGTAAEICKEAMVSLYSKLDYPKCKMLVQVHDELVTSVPTDELGKWIPTINEAMGNGIIMDANGRVKHGVELKVDAHAAGSWAEAKG